MLDVTLAQGDLETLLRAVANAVPSKPHMPVLASALLEAEEGASALSCVGYDLNLGVRASAPAVVASGGIVAVPHRMLAALVGKLPAGEVVRIRHSTEADQLAVEAGEGRYSVTLGVDAADYPDLPVVAADPVRAPYGPLRAALGTVAHAVSQVEAKPELQGVRFALAGGELRLEAIDGAGHRAVFVRLPDLVTAGDDAAFTLPLPAVRELLRLDLLDDDLLELGQDGGVAVFRAGSTTLISNLLAGKWPPMFDKLPPKYKVSLIVNRDEMLAAVSRAQVIADLTECVIALDVTPDAITVGSENDLGHAADPVGLDEGSSAVTDRLLFRSKYLIDALKHTEGTQVSINYVKSGTLAILEPHGSVLHKYLVMGLAPKKA